MVARTGKDTVLVWDGITICTREKTLTINGENIDVTDGCSDGWQEVLEESGVRSVEITVSGLDKDDVLLGRSINGPFIAAATYTRASGAEISGNFRMSGFSNGEPYNEAATFEATFTSTGEVELTPA